MSSRRFVRIAAALLVGLSPAGAFAQAMVTTAPLGVAAPVLSPLMLVLLALLLAAVAVVILRRTPARAIAAVALLAIGTGLVGIGYATPTNVVVENEECEMRFTHEYNPQYGPRNLMSLCPNQIVIVDLDVNCSDTVWDLDGGGGAAVSICDVGRVLENGQSCQLPDCIDIE